MWEKERKSADPRSSESSGFWFGPWGIAGRWEPKPNQASCWIEISSNVSLEDALTLPCVSNGTELEVVSQKT